MKLELDNRTLMAYHGELEQMRSSVLHLLFKSRIDDFYKNNGIRIKRILERMRELQIKYFEMEEQETRDGKEPNLKLKMKNTASEGQPPKMERILLEGKELPDYEKEREALLAEKLNFIL